MPKTRLWPLLTTLCAVYVLFVAWRYGSPLIWVTLGSDFSGDEATAYSTEGYDGQFAYYIARDPTSAPQFIDVPAYRYQRILQPALGRVLSLGQEPLVPWALVLVNLAAFAVGTAFLEGFLSDKGLSRWYVAGYALSFGVFGATRLALTEPLAYGLCIVGTMLMLREKRFAGAVVFALAALTKETTLLFSAAFGLDLLLQRKIAPALRYGAIVLVPFFAWQVFLFQWLGAFGIGSGGANATGFEWIPFGAVFQIVQLLDAERALATLLLVLPIAVLPTLWAFWRCYRDWRNGAWSLFTTLLLTNAAIMPFVPLSTFIEPLGMPRFIVGLQIAVILYAAQRRNIRVLRYTTLWAFTLLLAIIPDLSVIAGGAATTAESPPATPD